MCLAIFKPAGKTIPVSHLREGWRHNSHGGGFAYVSQGLVKIQKGFMTFDAFYVNYRKRVRKNTAAVVHFRWATVGKKNEENCHPFRLSPTHAMVHNGTLSGVRVDDGKSDSSNFARRILGPIIRGFPNFTNSIEAQRLVNLAIGTSKVAVLSGEGDAIIYNEHLGTWDGDIWYSNDQYKRVSKSIHPSRPTSPKKLRQRPQQVYVDYHATNRGKGRSYIDDLQDMGYWPTPKLSEGTLTEGADSHEGFSDAK